MSYKARRHRCSEQKAAVLRKCHTSEEAIVAVRDKTTKQSLLRLVSISQSLSICLAFPSHTIDLEHPPKSNRLATPHNATHGIANQGQISI